MIRRLADQILMLSAEQLVTLNRILRQEGGEGVGVREPRTPSPESPGDAIVKDLPEDYWETAQ